VRAKKLIDRMSHRYNGVNGERIEQWSTVTIGINRGDGLPPPSQRE
jgi:hypothetical protein